jgi:hypothetical protein
MIRQLLRALAVVIPLSILAATCGGTVTSPSITTTTTTTTTSTTSTVSKTDTFSGTLGSGGSNVHVFNTLAGTFGVTMASIDPSAVLPPLGLAFGMWDGTSCTQVLTTQSAVVGTVMVGTASIETDVCIQVWDPTPWASGFTLSYSVTAIHYAKSS